MRAVILHAPSHCSFSVSTFDGETSVHDAIEGLSIDAAREIAETNSALGHSCTIDAEGKDYREVWEKGLPVRAGKFSQVTLVRIQRKE